MNVLAHAHVALRLLGRAERGAGASGRGHVADGTADRNGTADRDGTADRYVLGAVLPDLAPMAGVRIDRAALPAPIADGVRCHVNTDAAFHAHPAFTRGARAIRRALDERGVASGPARAVGHAGWELLLDGTLVGSPAEGAFRRSLATGGDLAGALLDGDARRWHAFLAHGRSSPAMAYDDPVWVAERLARMLARRPRLRLPDHQVGIVAEVLTTARSTVAAAADEVLATTVATVAEIAPA